MEDRMWKLMLLVILVMITVVEVSGATNTTSDITEKHLIRHLLYDYEAASRPVRDPATTVNVSATLRLVTIDNLNEKEELLTTFVWFNMQWKDEFLVWDPDEWKGIEKVIIPGALLWCPDLVIRNSAKKVRGDVLDERRLYRYIVYSDGTVIAWMAGEVTTMCSIDVTYFPFDDQACHIGIDSWIYSVEQLNLTASTEGADLSMYEESGQWDLLDTRIKRVVDTYEEDGRDAKFSVLKVEIYVRRKPMFYVYNIIIPSVLLSLLVLLVFLIPAAAGEKISLGITILLSFTVFQLIIVDSMPKTSDTLPVLVLYIIWTTSLTTVSLFFAVCVLIIHHRSEDLPVPKWLQCLVICLAKILRRKSSKLRIHPGNDSTEDGNSERDLNRRLYPATTQCEDGHQKHQAPAANNKLDWVEVARVIDLSLMWVFLVVTIISSVFMVGIYPLTKPDFPTMEY